MLLSAGRQLAGWEAGQKDMEGYRNVSDQRVGTYILFPPDRKRHGRLARYSIFQKIFFKRERVSGNSLSIDLGFAGQRMPSSTRAIFG